MSNSEKKIAWGRCLAVALVTVFFLSGVHNAAAADITLKTCLKASAEREALLAQGYDAYLDQGPKWARMNLTPAKFDGVKRLIVLIETLEFRCNTRAMKARKKRMNSPAFKRWKAVRPPLPQRNPRFVALKLR